MEYTMVRGARMEVKESRVPSRDQECLGGKTREGKWERGQITFTTLVDGSNQRTSTQFLTVS